MTFSDPIVDDTELVRDAIQSPNYEPGVAGWAINADGTAEFVDVQARGAVQVGAPGQHGSMYSGPVAGDEILAQFAGADYGQITYADAGIASADVTQYDPTEHRFGDFSRWIFKPVAGVATSIATMWTYHVDNVTGLVTGIFGAGFRRWTNAADEVVVSNELTVEGSANIGGLPVVSGPLTAAGRQHWQTQTVTFSGTGMGTFTHAAGFVPTHGLPTQQGTGGSVGVNLIYISGTATTVTLRATTSAGAFAGAVTVTLLLCA